MAHDPAPDQQVTRRQLRERRNATNAEVSPDRRDNYAENSKDAAAHAPAPNRADSLATRRSRRLGPGSTRSHSKRAPRAAILMAFGAATIAAPLTGFTTPGHGPHFSPHIETSTPIAQTLQAAALQTEIESSAAPALNAVPNAPAVALDLSARNQARTETTCSPQVGASGVREASTERTSPMILPLAPDSSRTTSHFGPRWGTTHTGVDMAAPLGTPIYAAADGEVVVHAPNGQEGRSGNLLIIKSVIDGETVWFWYGHMFDDGVYVKEGDKVEAGQIIGGIGNKGRSTGPHTHVEVHVGTWDNEVDPEAFFASQGAVYPGTC